MKCLECNNEFVPKRSTARYCSPRCRKLAFLSVPVISVPLKVSVPMIKPIKKVSELPSLSKSSIKTIPALRMGNIMANRMTFGGSVKQKRIYYTLPNGEVDSMKFTD